MSLKSKVAAIVVLYNPNVPTLVRLLESVRGQVSYIIIVDNSTQHDIKKKVVEMIPNNSIYTDLKGNMGIAGAQNKGIEIAKTISAEFVLFLDQDSVLPNNMVSDLMTVYKDLVTNGHKVATVGPSFLDEKTNELAKVIRHRKLNVERIIPDQSKYFVNADYIISSGSLVPMDVLDNIGVMDEQLFIDWVDIEWCIRAKQFGYKCYVAPQIIMRHCIGDDFVSMGKTKVNLHTDFRHYFIVRNSIYLSLYSTLPSNFKVIQLGKVPLYILFYSYHSKKPLYSLSLLTKAVVDGVFKNMGEGHFK